MYTKAAVMNICHDKNRCLIWGSEYTSETSSSLQKWKKTLENVPNFVSSTPQCSCETKSGEHLDQIKSWFFSNLGSYSSIENYTQSHSSANNLEK